MLILNPCVYLCLPRCPPPHSLRTCPRPKNPPNMDQWKAKGHQQGQSYSCDSPCADCQCPGQEPGAMGGCPSSDSGATLVSGPSYQWHSWGHGLPEPCPVSTAGNTILYTVVPGRGAAGSCCHFTSLQSHTWPDDLGHTVARWSIHTLQMYPLP